MGQPFKTSRSTLPASDATLAWVSITNSLCSLAFSWILICGIGLTWFLAHAALYHDVSLNDAAQRIQEWTASPGAWSFPAISGILLAWYATGIGTATGLSGRTWLTYSPMWGLFIVLLIIAAIANLNQPTAEFCLIAFWSAVLVGCNLGCLLALVVGLKRRAIGARTVIASGLLLLTIESVSYFATSAHELARLGSWYWGIALLLSLVAAPPIVVPLAVHFNRHR